MGDVAQQSPQPEPQEPEQTPSMTTRKIDFHIYQI